MQLLRLFRLEDYPAFTKPIDPSLYLHRFTEKLKFGPDKTKVGKREHTENCGLGRREGGGRGNNNDRTGPRWGRRRTHRGGGGGGQVGGGEEGRVGEEREKRPRGQAMWGDTGCGILHYVPLLPLMHRRWATLPCTWFRA